jgi:hypothetical protein
MMKLASRSQGESPRATPRRLQAMVAPCSPYPRRSTARKPQIHAKGSFLHYHSVSRRKKRRAGYDVFQREKNALNIAHVTDIAPG